MFRSGVWMTSSSVNLMRYVTPNIQKPLPIGNGDFIHTGIGKRKIAGVAQRQLECPVENAIYNAAMTNDGKG